jgi:hypothetical protein
MGDLDKALRSFNDGDGGNEFERRWQAVGANLRAGLARLVIALDDAPASLERMVRFLAQNSELDVQLVAIERYAASEIGEVVVPRFVVGTEAVKRQPPPNEKEPRQELLRTVEAYNSLAPPDLQAVGVATYYRQVRPPDWPTSLRRITSSTKPAVISVRSCMLSLTVPAHWGPYSHSWRGSRFLEVVPQ